MIIIIGDKYCSSVVIVVFLCLIEVIYVYWMVSILNMVKMMSWRVVFWFFYILNMWEWLFFMYEIISSKKFVMSSCIEIS